ncbi:N-ATPase subunit AtpR [Paenirhodobacter hankyongi]|uniref:ATP synthase subunit I n=1 Tax=Paenirhodobacter hankyongi TaxID=2294033 RepID=A0A421BVV4_9RHOB|nr:ATP synthase subunit I [Sinirhodobacter hankyongi]RLL72454.1 hypothetical protein DYS74_03340 [Sinirhodobacter hankyongi]
MSQSAQILLSLAALGLGTGAGWLHFRTLRAVSDRLLSGDLTAVALQVGRFAVLGLFLFLCARAGAAPLVTGAAGVLIGRRIALKRMEAAA